MIAITLGQLAANQLGGLAKALELLDLWRQLILLGQ
jgi:hypothetical protein